MVKDFRMDMYTLLYLKWIATKDLLYSTWNCSVLSSSLDGREVWARMDTWTCMAESLWCSPENTTTLLISNVLVPRSCLTLCNSMGCSLPGSLVHGILQARKLEWIAISSPRDLPYAGIEPRSPTLQPDS